jgi:hypothetical protein
MPETSPSGDLTGSAGAPARASDELVHEQTVRAPIPVAPTSETTVRAPMPTPPAQEHTVRAFVPSAVPGSAASLEVEELEEVELEPEADPDAITPEVIDVGALVSELEANARRKGTDLDAPVARHDQVTVPEAIAKPHATGEPPGGPARSAGAGEPRPRRKRPRDEGPALRPEPPAVKGEVSVAEPEPDGIFDPAPPRREERVRATPQPRGPTVRRDDPPLVSGEVAIDPAASQSPEVPTGDVYVMPMTGSAPQSMMTSSGSHPIMLGSSPQANMTASGPQPMMHSSGVHPIMTPAGMTPAGMTPAGMNPSSMTASGPQPMMHSSGVHPIMTPAGMTTSGASPVMRRSSTDPGYGSEATGPQPRGQAETTGPHPLMRGGGGRTSSHDSLVLWVLAGTLVVLAVGGVMLVISWAQ